MLAIALALALGSAARSPLSGVTEVKVTSVPDAMTSAPAHPLADIPGGLPGVVDYGYVANYATSMWPRGEWVALHCDFSAPRRVRLTGMMGSVHLAGAVGPALENLTLVDLSDAAPVEPGDVAELRYIIRPSVHLAPITYRVQANR